jgi:hypothetical protein
VGDLPAGAKATGCKASLCTRGNLSWGWVARFFREEEEEEEMEEEEEEEQQQLLQIGSGLDGPFETRTRFASGFTMRCP